MISAGCGAYFLAAVGVLYKSSKGLWVNARLIRCSNNSWAESGCLLQLHELIEGLRHLRELVLPRCATRGVELVEQVLLFDGALLAEHHHGLHVTTPAPETCHEGIEHGVQVAKAFPAAACQRN